MEVLFDMKKEKKHILFSFIIPISLKELEDNKIKVQEDLEQNVVICQNMNVYYNDKKLKV